MGYAVTSASQICSRRSSHISRLRLPSWGHHRASRNRASHQRAKPQNDALKPVFIQSSIVSVAQSPVRERYDQRWRISFPGKTKKAGTSLRTDLRLERSRAPLHPWSPGSARPFTSSSCRNRTSEPSRGHPCWYRRKPSRYRCRQQVPSKPDRSRRSLRPCQGSRRRSQSRR